MVKLPEFKIGDELECIDGNNYSRIKIITNNDVSILYGDNSGNIMSISDWVLMVKDNNGIIRNTMNTFYQTYMDSIHTSNNLTLRTNSNSSSNSSIRSSKSVTFNSKIDIIEIESNNRRRSILDLSLFNPIPDLVLEQYEIPEPLEPEPIKIPKLPWYYNIFLCCIDLD